MYPKGSEWPSTEPDLDEFSITAQGEIVLKHLWIMGARPVPADFKYGFANSEQKHLLLQWRRKNTAARRRELASLAEKLWSTMPKGALIIPDVLKLPGPECGVYRKSLCHFRGLELRVVTDYRIEKDLMMDHYDLAYTSTQAEIP